MLAAIAWRAGWDPGLVMWYLFVGARRVLVKARCIRCLLYVGLRLCSLMRALVNCLTVLAAL